VKEATAAARASPIVFFLRALLAPGRPIRALASDGSVAVRSYDPQSSAVRSKDYQVNVASVLRTCYENVANTVACNIQHQ
jgi:hypothetical protein